MLKNKEMFYVNMINLGLVAVIVILHITFPAYTLFYIIIGFLLIAGLYSGFTWYRYKRLAQLTDNIEDILNGGNPYNLARYSEGELSYLESVLSKVMIRYKEQSELLVADNNYLVDTLSDISHQLKTPLTSMMMMAELLNDPGLPVDKREEFTTAIGHQLERIEWLVSTLLKMSKLDAGTVVLKKESISFKELIERATAHLQLPLQKAGISLDIGGSEQAVFTGDIAWTKEAVANIVKNCVEHTGQGGTVSIQYGQNHLYSFIKIADTGEGIAKNDLPHIFERFYKGENSGPDSVGIGLSIANQIVKAQSGTIHVESESGRGTEFQLKFYNRVI